jgi:phage terminase large subunit-like protein
MRLKKSMGSVAFAKAYRNIVLTAENAVFKVEWLNKAKERGKNRRLIETLDYSRWDLGQLTIAAGVDLAISQKDGSDFTAMSVIGCTRDGTKIPLYAIRDKLSPAEVRQNIIDIWERFQPAVIIVENNGYQEAIRRDLADTTSLPIKAYTTGGEKFDAEIGINSMAVEFENGKWIIPYDKDSHSTMTLMDHLIEGLLRFPSGHTEDLVMATWFANNGLRDLLNSTKNATISVGKHGLW